MTEQLDRKTFLGGSDIAAVMGMDPYRSPLSVFNDKLGISEREPASYAMRKGTHFEKAIFSLYAETRKVWLGDAGYTPPHPLFPFLRGSYDRLLLSGKGGEPVALLEGKTASIRQSHKWSTPGEDPVQVPLQYFTQQTWYTGLLGLPEGRLVADLDWYPDDLGEYVFVFNADFFELCVESGARFWTDHVETGVPPEPEVHKSTHDEIVKLWPKGDPGKAVPAPEELEEMWDRALVAYRDKKTAEAFLTQFKEAVQFVAKDASVVEFKDGACKVIDKRGSLSYKDLSAHFASLAGIEIGSPQWNEACSKFTGKGTRYVKLGFTGEGE